MNTKKPLLLTSILVVLMGMTGLRPAISRATNSLNCPTEPANRAALQAVIVPKITKATIEKKDLIVEGESFGAGANVLLNGTRTLKARNDDILPTTRLIVRKGRNSLPVDEVVSLQVKNPDGQVSEAIGFFTGLTFTYHNTQDGVSNSLRVGEIFLLNFDDVGFWPWVVHDYGRLGEVIDILSFKVPLMPKAQGFFLAKQPGAAFIRMRGEPFGQPPFSWLVNLDVQ